MPTTPKQWRGEFEICETATDPFKNTETITLYGSSVDDLRRVVRAYLQEKKPVYFANKEDSLLGKLRYAYSDGTSISFFFERKKVQGLPEGWWYSQLVSVANPLRTYTKEAAPRQRIRNFDSAIEHFVSYGLIPKRGPDYQSKALVKGDFRLPFMQKLLREADITVINDLIERGWHVLALEYTGEISMTGELMNRHATFVLGHAEIQAALSTLNGDYYQRITQENIAEDRENAQ